MKPKTASQKTAKTSKKGLKTPKKAPKVITPEVLENADEDETDDSEDTEDDVIESADFKRIEPVEVDSDLSENALVATSLPSTQHDLLKSYIRDISRYPLLSPEEELKLANQLIKTGDMNAARKLVSANLRLVVKIAMEYRNTYQNVMDLIQEGNIGLMKAVSKFDPSKGAKLSYYSSWWIRSYILKYILDNFRLIRVGTTQAQKKLFFHLMREKEKLEAQGLDAGPKLLAEKLDVREKDIIEMQQRLGSQGSELSLNVPVSSDGESKSTHMDLIKDTHESQDEELAMDELKQILTANLDEFAKTLKEKELAIFKERLASEDPKTLQEVADKFGLTRERARQIESKVIEKLREFYKELIS